MRLRLVEDAVTGACVGAAASLALGMAEYETSKSHIAGLHVADAVIYGTLWGVCAGVCAGTLLERPAAGAVATSVGLLALRAVGG
jgi:hypothetical protein